MLVAKTHTIRARLADKKPDRLSDKDAADMYRIMQTARPADLGRTLRDLRVHPMAGPVTSTALDLMRDLFGDRRGDGIAMAQRSLALAIPEAQLAAVSVAFTTVLLDIATA